MPPKPGNAFAQQKELQRQKELDTKVYEDDMPSTPMTTMSMFIGPEITTMDKESPATLGTPANGDHSHKNTTGRRKQGQQGQRACTDPVPAPSGGASEPSSFGKQSTGLKYIRSKFTNKTRKTKDAQLSSQYPTKPGPYIVQPGMSNSATLSNFHKHQGELQARPPTIYQQLPSQPLPPHFSTATTRTAATSESRYASLLKNDAMILGNNSITPTLSGSYALSGYPAIVAASHPSIMSMEGSILGPSSRGSGATVNPNIFASPFALAEPYNTSYTAPLPPPPGEEFQEHPPFQQQLPFYLQNPPRKHFDQINPRVQQTSHPLYETYQSGTWEQLHAQYPATMPQFSPVNPQYLRQDDSESKTVRAQRSEAVDLVRELQKEATYNSNAPDSKSDNGKEAPMAIEGAEDDAAEAIAPIRGSLRKSTSVPELNKSSDQLNSPTRTPVARKEDRTFARRSESYQFQFSAKAASTTTPPVMMKADQQKGSPFQHSEPLQGPLRDVRENDQSLQGASASFRGTDFAQDTSPDGNGEFLDCSNENQTTHGGYPPTPQHPHYQSQSSLDEQMVHHFNVVHHHMEAVKTTLRRCIEDCKNSINDNSSTQMDARFMSQFRQLCVQNNGFRQYLERIQLQTTNMRQGVVDDVVPSVAYEISGRFKGLEQHLREEYQRLHRTFLTLNENVNLFQRNVSQQMTNMNGKMDEMNRKIDLLLRAQVVNGSNEDQHASYSRDATQYQPREDASQTKREVENQNAMVENRNKALTTTAALSSLTTSPTTQVSTSSTKTRKPTPLPGKVPIMAAALTSTPPHVPQLPKSQSQTSSLATITITDPNIPSPSAVSNARRIKHGHSREPRDARQENNRPGVVVKGLADAKSTQGPGTQVHPALRYQEGIERLTGAKEKQEAAEEKKKKEQDDDRKVLWRRSSGDGEIGSKWYEAAMQQ